FLGPRLRAVQRRSVQVSGPVRTRRYPLVKTSRYKCRKAGYKAGSLQDKKSDRVVGLRVCHPCIGLLPLVLR
ncbi:hypothetical protein FRC06_007678, partial [Ceratobasidium sp. 370]